MQKLVLVMAQINPVVGDIDGNTALIIDAAQRADKECGADVVVFPELSICGYPPEDLLLRPSMKIRIDAALLKLSQQSIGPAIVLGYPHYDDTHCFNRASVLLDGRWVAHYDKQKLPNYQVFDEQRYFKAGVTPCVFDYRGISLALTICEDIWHPEPMAQARNAGARVMINLNASPFHLGKPKERLVLLQQRAQEGNMPIIYVNQVGGQDELVFDGASCVVDASGELCVQAASYISALAPVELSLTQSSPASVRVIPQSLPQVPSDLEAIYETLVLGMKDYVGKNGFKRAVLGLSGGIDSALTLAIAVDALGADSVSAIMMPFRYTSELSRNDAQTQAQAMGVDYQVISIEAMYEAFMAGLADNFSDKPQDLTEQNLQARCRGVILMAISNKTGAIVLTTGNKSEIAVGYSTLYGDMAGGFDVLKDVPKTLVFELAKYRNKEHRDSSGAFSEFCIPPSVIERPPSAELAPDQKDEDNLPPYPILDQILQRYIDDDQSADVIVAAGFDRDTVYRVIRLVDVNEYKRRQAPVGVRISERGFGRDRRYPITNGWKAGQ